MRTEVTVDEAQRLAADHLPALGIEQVPLLEAYGRVLASDLVAQVDHPGADNSSMDGYAVRALDTQAATPEAPVRLELVEEIPAGYLPQRPLGPGQAARIMTGGILPPLADAVVRLEDTRSSGAVVEVLAPAKQADVRRRGEDFFQGQVGLVAGTCLGPAQVGFAASMGYAALPVRRQPRVAVLSTGSEVVEPGQPLAPTQVYNSNTYTLAGMVQQCGGVPLVLGAASDEPELLRQQLHRAAQHDLIMTSGAVSVGQYDLVRQLLEEEAALYFWKVQLRPGSPVLFGAWQGRPLWGLPGNPVAAAVVAAVLVRPYLYRALGRNDPPHQVVRALAEGPFRAASRPVLFVRICLEQRAGRYYARSTGPQGSGILKSLVLANALAMIPPGRSVAPGDELDALLL
ncbi:MAG: molybdopterin molybdotransferase MoeA [Deinococcus sp.]|nr:molybdopterin molybdotransferase MoeA [Deinococcus sp.]